MDNELQQIREFFGKLKNLFKFLTFVQLLYLIVVTIIILLEILKPLDNLQDVFLIAVIFSNFFTYLALRLIYGYFMRNKNPDVKLKDKTEQFQYLAVFRLGVIFIDNLLNITVFLFSQSFIILIIIFIAFILFFTYKPSVKSFNKNYNENLELN